MHYVSHQIRESEAKEQDEDVCTELIFSEDRISRTGCILNCPGLERISVTLRCVKDLNPNTKHLKSLASSKIRGRETSSLSCVARRTKRPRSRKHIGKPRRPWERRSMSGRSSVSLTTLEDSHVDGQERCSTNPTFRMSPLLRHCGWLC